MERAKHGDRVTAQYIGTLDNGRIFDSTVDEEPLVFTIGAEEVFAALEEAVTGMAVGEVKNVFVPVDKAYGPRKRENELTVRRDLFPPDREVEVGQKLRIEFGDGEEKLMMVLKASGTEVVLDGNHALAGLDLTFALRLDGIG